ncbi:MAG TPA: glycoside hydrolase family 3 N-terminal domain-containing protein [Gemmatimonadaceae bacterium]|nr:glycoside hydrolase family 3 N-terminal domain-containing protein [Gemmatimonadaceae bacterium]
MAALFIGACARPQRTGPEARAVHPPSPIPLPSGSGQWVDSVLGSLSLREKAAQMVWPTVLADYVPASSAQWQRLRDEIGRERVGGYTISVGSPLEVAAKLNAMQAMAAVPLIVGADLEFGAGYRARGGYFVPNAIDLGGATVFPPEMAVGATRDTALAYEQGRVTAIEGRALGIHVAYAPILDVNNNPGNPVINTRSYGEDPRLAARMGASFVRGLQEHGMVATGKHFPGHGDTEVNSHLALPSVGASRERLDSVELVPFRAAVGAGLGAVMSFHGAMPALDPSGAPGTLSPRVLTGLLREQLGFRGVIISDAMDMRGVLDRYGPVRAARLAVAAGADVLIQPLSVTETIDAVVAGVREGDYPESRLDASVRRILEAKYALGLHRRRFVSLDSARAVVGDSANGDVARRVAERSITLVKDSLRRLPLGRLAAGARVLSVTVARRTDLPAGVAFDAELRTRFGALRSEFVNADDAGSSFQRLLLAADSADVVLVSSYMGHAWNATSASAPRAFVDFVRQLAQRGARPVVVAFGNPYLLQQIPEAPAYVVAWGGFPVSQQAAAKALLGTIPFAGRLPITIPGYAAYGAGEK